VRVTPSSGAARLTPLVPSASAGARDVEWHAVSFASQGDVSLTGAWCTPAGVEEPAAVVVIVGGAGVPARAYRHLASHLASCGAAVLTFDYRGVGASRVGGLRRLVARIEEWSADIGAALHVARRRYPGVELHAVAHSVGAFLLGCAPGAPWLGRVVLLAPHTGYWGDYPRRWRPVMRLAWHVLMPGVTRLVGYFPARALGMGDDLPKGIALDWAARRHPDVLHSPAARARLAELVRRFEHVHAATLAVTALDDAFAPVPAGARLLGYYPNGPEAAHEVVAPADLGVRRVGHYGFLLPGPGEYFWERAARWLELSADDR